MSLGFGLIAAGIILTISGWTKTPIASVLVGRVNPGNIFDGLDAGGDAGGGAIKPPNAGFGGSRGGGLIQGKDAPAAGPADPGGIGLTVGELFENPSSSRSRGPLPGGVGRRNPRPRPRPGFGRPHQRGGFR